MNIYPVIKIIFDRRKVSDKKKEGIIEIEVYFQRKRKWISTGISVLPKHWNDQKLVVGRMDAADLNLQIKNFEKIFTDVIRKLISENKPFSWSDYDELFGNPPSEILVGIFNLIHYVN